MSYLDESEYDDRSRDERGADRRRRSTQPARPAWDAATYGTPDDMRRSRRPPPPPGRGSNAIEDPFETRAPPYPPTPYPQTTQADRYPAGVDAYRAPDPYPSEAFRADPYPSETYPSETYPGSAAPYPGGSYEGDSYRPYEAGPYEAAPDAYSSRLQLDFDEPPTRGAEDYPGGLRAAEDASEPTAGKAGRNLPAAIGVGIGLAGLAVGSLYLWRPAFLGVLAVAVGLGVWELVRAIRASGANPPLVPLIAGGGLMMGLAWWGHADALTFGLMVTVLAAMVWRLADGVGGYGRDVTAATLVAVYVPFLVGFAALLATPSDGDLRVIVTLAGVILSDTGGYIAGVLFGRHPMAPSVSPKKSWEGLIGSLVAAGVGGAILLHYLFDVQPMWGAVFGLAVSAAAVVGDLGESMIKRDLGVKDMSQLLPGHGGVMDRLDSIVLAAPTAYVLLVLMAPPL